MKSTHVLIILASMIAVAAAQGPGGSPNHSTSTNNVTAQFLGRSGGMKIYPNNAPWRYLEVKQAKLEEIYPTNTSVAGMKINVAGKNEWSDFVTVNQVSATTFTLLDGEADFELTAYFTDKTQIVSQPTPCPTVGPSSSPTTTTGTPTTTTVSPTLSPTPTTGTPTTTTLSPTPTTGTPTTTTSSPTSPTVARRRLLQTTGCTTEVKLVAGDIKFSFEVSNWSFESTSNRFHYGLILDDNATNVSGNSSYTVINQTVDEIVFGNDLGSLTVPLMAFADGNEITVNVSMSVNSENKTEIDFIFPSFTSKLEYDPTIHVNPAPFIQEDEDEAPILSVANGMGVSIATVTLFAAFSMFMH